MSQEQTSHISTSDIKNKVFRKRNGKTIQLDLPLRTQQEVAPVSTATNSVAPYGYRPNGKPYLRRPSVKKTVARSAKRNVSVTESPWAGLQKYVSKLVDTQVEIAVNKYITKAFK